MSKYISSEKQDFNPGRRDFLVSMGLMAGAASTVSFLPAALAAPGADRWRGRSPAPYRFTEMDEALGNYPGYSAAIGFGRGHLPAFAMREPADEQLVYDTPFRYANPVSGRH